MKKGIIVIATILSFGVLSPMHIKAEEIVNIPDTNLKACINVELGQGSNEEVSKTQMESLTKLECEKKGIKEITGLEKATSLKNLYLINNKIEDIAPLKDLTRLQVLYLDFNEIEDIAPLKDLTSLAILYSDNNKIEDLTALKDLTSLTELGLVNNEISDIIALKDLTSLQYLNLNNNQIEDLTPLKDLTSLKKLSLNYNKISDITALKNLTSLQYLNLKYNKISDFFSLKNITARIDVGNQEVSEIIPNVKTQQGKKEYEYKGKVIEQNGTAHEISFMIDTDKLKEGENEIVKNYNFGSGYNGEYKINFVYYTPSPIGTPNQDRPEVSKPDGNKPDGNKPDGNKPDGNKPEINKPDGKGNNGMKIVSTGSSIGLLTILIGTCTLVAILLKRRIRL